ncbi:hypothetical protein BDY19DRAFT_910560 [Irpex rosettiformis]|uniref:Uncharacterized protein n=1 Tax=Irpex rosettiformis TaxID=378272 RepID=A0ACB8TNC0_9APHY|nr:hypothetical protein BDY19DRAFT_910560 [Irpex rosettiformis]
MSGVYMDANYLGAVRSSRVVDASIWALVSIGTRLYRKPQTLRPADAFVFFKVRWPKGEGATMELLDPVLEDMGVFNDLRDRVGGRRWTERGSGLEGPLDCREARPSPVLQHSTTGRIPFQHHDHSSSLRKATPDSSLLSQPLELSTLKLGRSSSHTLFLGLKRGWIAGVEEGLSSTSVPTYAWVRGKSKVAGYRGVPFTSVRRSRLKLPTPYTDIDLDRGGRRLLISERQVHQAMRGALVECCAPQLEAGLPPLPYSKGSYAVTHMNDELAFHALANCRTEVPVNASTVLSITLPNIEEPPKGGQYLLSGVEERPRNLYLQILLPSQETTGKLHRDTPFAVPGLVLQPDTIFADGSPHRLVLSNKRAAYGFTWARNAINPIETAFLALQLYLKTLTLDYMVSRLAPLTSGLVETESFNNAEIGFVPLMGMYACIHARLMLAYSLFSLQTLQNGSEWYPVHIPSGHGLRGM